MQAQMTPRLRYNRRARRRLSLGRQIVERSIMMGRDVAVTNASASGSKQSAMVGGSGVWRNLVSTDLTDWTKENSRVGIVPLGSGTYRLTFNGGGGTGIRHTIASSSTSRTGSPEVRLISGSFKDDAATDFIGFEGSASPQGTVNKLADITSGWQAIVSASDGDTTDSFSIVSDNDFVAVIEIRNIRATDTPSPAPAFPVGSGAGHVLPDLLKIGGLYAYFSGTMQANLVSTDFLTDWAKVESNGTVTITDVGDGSVEIAMSPIAGFGLFYQDITPSVPDALYTSALEIQLVSGNSTGYKFELRQGGLSSEVELGSITSEWSLVELTITTPITDSINMQLINAAAVTDATFRIRNPRLTNLSSRVPPFVAGTGAGEAVAVDQLSCTPTFGASGTIVQATKFYGTGTIAGFGTNMHSWNSDNNFIGYWKNSGTPQYTGDDFSPDLALAAIDGGRNNLLITSYSYDGVNIIGRYQQEPSVSAAESAKPTGTLYIGNNPGGIRPGHTVVVTLLVPNEVLSDDEFDAVWEYILSILDSLQLN